jgi:ATP-dependent Lon protease
MGYDLSKVMFIATSNTMSSIQPARDRMEIKKCQVIIEEKVEIARQHLLPRQLKEHGTSDLTF